MFSVQELAGNIGRPAHYMIHELVVEVKILDARQVFDRVDYLVEPVKGTGRSWVSRSAVRVLPKD